MVGLTCAYGVYRIYQIDAKAQSSEQLKVGIVEGDVGIFQIETREKRRNHLLIQQKLSAELERQGVDLIVWPESAYRRKTLPRPARTMRPSSKPLVDDYRQDRGTPEAERAAPQRGFRTPFALRRDEFSEK